MLLAGGVFFACLQGKTIAAEDSVFAGIAAEYYYRVEYKGKKGHKAFAIGPFGSYGYSWDYGTPREAANSALKWCRDGAAWWQKKYGVSGKCRLLAQGNTLLIKNPWIGPDWQKPSTGEDFPLLKGRKNTYRGSTLNGVVLHVHGCNGMGWDKFAEVWGSYFNALGYDFFVPDSFAETRPAEVCGQPPPARARDKEVIMKLRVAQTLRNIAELKRKYPGKPIYIWGHSEGSAVVKYLEADVAGIIASGDECDVAGLRIAAPASIPVLFLFGDNDPYIEGFSLPLTDKKMQKCRNFVRNKKTKIVIVKNSKHEYWPWRPEIAKAVSQFIGAKSSGLPELLLASNITLNDSQKAVKAAYAKGVGHKAFAAMARGASAWSGKWDFAEDAAQYALYDCARADNVRLFSLPTHYCAVLDVDGKDMTKP